MVLHTSWFKNANVGQNIFFSCMNEGLMVIENGSL